jgi:hypothetical protein
MSNVELLRQAGVEVGPEMGELSRERIESLNEEEMTSLLALYATEERTEILWDNEGWADQTRTPGW